MRQGLCRVSYHRSLDLALTAYGPNDAKSRIASKTQMCGENSCQVRPSPWILAPLNHEEAELGYQMVRALLTDLSVISPHSEPQIRAIKP